MTWSSAAQLTFRTKPKSDLPSTNLFPLWTPSPGGPVSTPFPIDARGCGEIVGPIFKCCFLSVNFFNNFCFFQLLGHANRRCLLRRSQSTSTVERFPVHWIRLTKAKTKYCSCLLSGWQKSFEKSNMQMTCEFMVISQLLGGQFWCTFRRFVR